MIASSAVVFLGGSVCLKANTFEFVHYLLSPNTVVRPNP